MRTWLSTLKFQMMVSLLALTALFAVANWYTLRSLNIERQDDALLRLGGELRLIAQQMSMQAMNYKENAPRDYPTYRRDLRLYYRDLLAKTVRLEAIAMAFASGHFPGELTGMDASVTARLKADAHASAARLAQSWEHFHADLQRKIGSDPEEPRLEWAAEHVIEAGPGLEADIDILWRTLQVEAANRQRTADLLHRIVLSLAALLAAGILTWFYLRVLRPLGATVRGVRKISAGDFQHRVPVGGNNEIGWLGAEFNRLADRLYAVFHLLTRLEQGSDLEETLRLLSQTLPTLLPLDWAGVLFVDPDGQARLEAACRDGRVETVRLERFPVTDTVLEATLREQRPQHILDLQGLAVSSPRYRLIRMLNDIGMRDAIFMPIKENSPLPGLLVFAARQPNAYTQEHMELVSNLALLITLSFGRTLRLAEHARLAAIGQFASGIVHEIRNPLATITLGLDFLKSIELPAKAVKRTALASAEAARLAKLLEDILLFAKPIRLESTPVSLPGLITEVLETNAALLENKRLVVDWSSGQPEIPVCADADRLRQVLLNLLRNAVDAAEEGGVISLTLEPDSEARTANIVMCNDGEPINAGSREQLFEPFFTTKREGTGLGLPVVRRLVEAHGGRVSLESRGARTCATVVLPLAAPDQA